MRDCSGDNAKYSYEGLSLWVGGLKEQVQHLTSILVLFP